MENIKEQSMKLHDWEVTIQQMIKESNQEAKESSKFRVLMEWRAKLAQKPHLLQPCQIDKIVREVRKGLTNTSPHPSSGSPARLASGMST